MFYAIFYGNSATLFEFNLIHICISVLVGPDGSFARRKVVRLGEWEFQLYKREPGVVLYLGGGISYRMQSLGRRG